MSSFKDRDFTFDIKGAEELEKALQQLPYKFRKSIAKKAIRAGANVLLQKAREYVPVGPTGNLKKSLGLVARSRAQGDAVISVATRITKGFKGYHAHLLEFGTVKMPAQPFLRPALDSSSPAVIKRVGEVILENIQKGALGNFGKRKKVKK